MGGLSPRAVVTLACIVATAAITGPPIMMTAEYQVTVSCLPTSGDANRLTTTPGQ